MIEIELPCCGTTVTFEASADHVDCETCGVVLELEVAEPTLLALAA